MFNYVKRSLLITLLALAYCNLHAQTSLKPLAQSIQEARSANLNFHETTLFDPSEILDNTAAEFAREAQFLTLNNKVLQHILQNDYPALQLQLPYHGEMITIDLVRVNVTSHDFKVTGSTREANEQVKPGKHYRGIVHGDEQSIAAFSFFDDDVMGLFSTERAGNYVLGKLKTPGNQTGFILYEDRKLAQKSGVDCGVIDEEHTIRKQATEIVNRGSSTCIRQFIEVDNRLYQTFGTMQATVNYVTGLYNQVASIISNEGVPTIISEIYVWQTPDNYSYNVMNSAVVLGQFIRNRIYFNGDVANLLGKGEFGNLGGIASEIGGLCNPGQTYTFNHVFSFYSNVPVYSWSVDVFTHELGHTLGSYHTHYCAWPNGPIDGCGPAGGFPYEGNSSLPPAACPPAPIPTNGGTIMSYCHLVTVGKNFSLGFGFFPGKAIREGYENAVCLQDCCNSDFVFSQNTGCFNCAAPVHLQYGGQEEPEQLGFSWDAVPNAAFYRLYYRILGDDQWVLAQQINNPFFIKPQFGPFPCGTTVEVVVETVCLNGEVSPKSNAAIVQVKGCQPDCPVPVGLTSSVTQTSVTLSWGAGGVVGVPGGGGGGGLLFKVRYRPRATNTWTTVFTNNFTHTFNGLSPATSYIAQVQTICGNNESNITTRYFGTAAPPVNCFAPQNIQSTSAGPNARNITWNNGINALTYKLYYREISAPTWNIIDNIAGNSYLLTGLLPSTTYEIRMYSVCATQTSGYSAAHQFTTPVNFGGGGGDEIDDRGMQQQGAILNIAPNPTANTTTVIFIPSESATLWVVDALGRTCLKMPIPAGESSAELDFGNHLPGIYWIRLTKDDGSTDIRRLIRL